MGQNLSEPVTEKDTSLEENSQYMVGCSSMQGWRNGILLSRLNTYQGIKPSMYNVGSGGNLSTCKSRVD